MTLTAEERRIRNNKNSRECQARKHNERRDPEHYLAKSTQQELATVGHVDWENDPDLANYVTECRTISVEDEIKLYAARKQREYNQRPEVKAKKNEYRRRKRADPEYHAQELAKKREYQRRAEVREHRNEYRRERYHTDPEFHRKELERSAAYRANRTPEQIEHQREYNREYKRRRKARLKAEAEAKAQARAKDAQRQREHAAWLRENDPDAYRDFIDRANERNRRSKQHRRQQGTLK